MSFKILNEYPEGEIRYYLTTAKLTKKDGRTSKVYTLLYDSFLDKTDEEQIIDHIAQGFLSEKGFRFRYLEDKWFILKDKEEGVKINKDKIFLHANQVELTKSKLSSKHQLEEEDGE